MVIRDGEQIRRNSSFNRASLSSVRVLLTAHVTGNQLQGEKNERDFGVEHI